MFVRFRETTHRLQVSLVETSRSDGKVRHEHVASLGSVPATPDIADRLAFWQRLHERLAKLANRLDAATQAKVLGAVQARVPMVTADEQRTLQLENARTDAQFWDSMANMHAGTIKDHKDLAAAAERKIADGEAQKASAAEHAARAKDRIAQIERGEDVAGGLGKPLTWEHAMRICREAGMTTSDMQHAQVLAALPEEAIPQIVNAGLEASDRAGKRMARRLLAAMLDRLDADAAE